MPALVSNQPRLSARVLANSNGAPPLSVKQPLEHTPSPTRTAAMRIKQRFLVGSVAVEQAAESRCHAPAFPGRGTAPRHQTNTTNTSTSATTSTSTSTSTS